MKTNLQQKAINLRLKGWSYSEISASLLVAKSTCSLWCQRLVLPKNALKRLERVQSEGQKRGQNSGHARALARDAKIMKKVLAKVKTTYLSEDIKKLVCSVMYWGEGSKNGNRVIFTNSDPLMIKAFLQLFRQSYRVEEKRFQASLHLHQYHNKEKQLRLWSKVTGIDKSRISIYNKTSSGTYKKAGYPGCISIRYNDVNISRDLEAYYKNFALLYGGLV